MALPGQVTTEQTIPEPEAEPEFELKTQAKAQAKTQAKPAEENEEASGAAALYGEYAQNAASHRRSAHVQHQGEDSGEEEPETTH